MDEDQESGQSYTLGTWEHVFTCSYLHVPGYLDFYLTAIHAEKSEKTAKSVWMPRDAARGEGSP